MFDPYIHIYIYIYIYTYAVDDGDIAVVDEPLGGEIWWISRTKARRTVDVLRASRDDVEGVAMMEVPLKEWMDVMRERVDVTSMDGVE